MAEIGKIVSSIRGKAKLEISGYVMSKDKNRGDLYYWCCEKRKTLQCGGYAITVLINGQYHLRNTKRHNHRPDATRNDAMITAVEKLYFLFNKLRSPISIYRRLLRLLMNSIF